MQFQYTRRLFHFIHPTILGSPHGPTECRTHAASSTASPSKPPPNGDSYCMTATKWAPKGRVEIAPKIPHTSVYYFRDASGQQRWTICSARRRGVARTETTMLAQEGEDVRNRWSMKRSLLAINGISSAKGNSGNKPAYLKVNIIGGVNDERTAGANDRRNEWRWMFRRSFVFMSNLASTPNSLFRSGVKQEWV